MTRLELSERRMWPVALICAVMFAIFAGVAWIMIASMSRSSVRNVFDLTVLLFQGFWLLGWSVGLLIFGALTVFFLFYGFYGASARLQDGRLVYVPRLGPPPDAAAPRPRELAPPSPMSPSGLALIGANLVPLAGVLFFGWDLASVIVLFWAESAVIGFYTVLKMAIVGKFAALFAAPFFVGHFGAFMAVHFLLIYALFVRGFDAAGPDPGVREALLGIFIPIWPSLAALFISHGVSFVANFMKRHEYAGTTMTALTTASYNRIIVMQLALIFGGWLILLLKSPVPALALLVLLKTALDLMAHRKEHTLSQAAGR